VKAVRKLEHWVIFKTDKSKYVLLGGNSGSYLSGTDWRMNSGITNVERVGDCYLITGNSGSVYEVSTHREGLHISFSYVFEQLENVEIVSMHSYLDERCNN